MNQLAKIIYMEKKNNVRSYSIKNKPTNSGGKE